MRDIPTTINAGHLLLRPVRWVTAIMSVLSGRDIGFAFYERAEPGKSLFPKTISELARSWNRPKREVFALVEGEEGVKKVEVHSVGRQGQGYIWEQTEVSPEAADRIYQTKVVKR